MEKTTFITKYETNGQSFYAKIFWKPNESNLFEMKMYYKDDSWSGQFTYDLAKERSEALLLSEEEYYNDIRKALSKDSNYTYDFDNKLRQENRAEFKWKKKSGAGFLTSSINLQRDEITESKDSLLDLLIAENQDLNNSINDVNLKNQELSTKLDRCVMNLDKAEETKTSLETELYGKFVQLLNTKKRRIMLLEDSLNKISKSNKH